jgi:flavorubredoxin
MTKALILYYSRTGNTEKMANAVAEGIKSTGKVEVEINYHVDTQDLSLYDAIIIGSPTYNHDMPIDFKKIFLEAAAEGISLKDKVGAVFGSYGWSGEAPKLILEIIKYKFEMKTIEPPLLVKYTPDTTALNDCRNFGKKISESLMNRI